MQGRKINETECQNEASNSFSRSKVAEFYIQSLCENEWKCSKFFLEVEQVQKIVFKVNFMI